VPIIEKNTEKVLIDGITDNWYKIKKNGTEGFVFGGYGMVINESYNIVSIDDIIKIFPEEIIVSNEYRYLFVYNNVPMIRLSYTLTCMNKDILLRIYYRPKANININEISREFNLELSNANSTFGTGSSYDQLKTDGRSGDIILNNGEYGRFYFGNWGTEWSYDIAAFLFEKQFNKSFDGLLIIFHNLWTNNNDRRIMNINNNYIEMAKSEFVKESLYYHLFYEMIKHLDIKLDK
jgi:hypothetical protein